MCTDKNLTVQLSNFVWFLTTVVQIKHTKDYTNLTFHYSAHRSIVFVLVIITNYVLLYNNKNKQLVTA